jgi:hypothetical protein
MLDRGIEAPCVRIPGGAVPTTISVDDAKADDVMAACLAAASGTRIPPKVGCPNRN